MMHIIVRRGFFKISVSALCLCTFLPVHSQGIRKESHGIKENRYWEITAGIEGMSFHSLDNKIQNLSPDPFAPSRFTLGASFGANRWFSPYIASRTRFSGYWGKALVSDKAKDNYIRFFSLEEHLMLNVSNIVAGADRNRIYNFIPHAGIGFSRDCTHHDNSIGFHGGLMNTVRLSRHMGLFFDLGYHLAGDKKGTSGRYYWTSAELGIQFKLGSNASSRSFYFASDHEIASSDIAHSFHNNNKARYNNEEALSSSMEGMVLVRRGNVRMGEIDNDTLWGRQIPQRSVSVDDIWMDQTEVTNAQYRKFVQDVVQSVIEKKLHDPRYEGSIEKVRESLYITNPITGIKTLDGSQLTYTYETYDELAAAMKENQIRSEIKKKILITKDTAYIDARGNVVRETIQRPLSSQYDFLNTYIVNVLPDTTVWVNDFPNSDNSMYLKYYYSHPDYQNHPVVGVTWEQANAYCAWRTEKRKEELGGDLGTEQPFRLPTEAEWEHAARGESESLFPWSKEVEHKGYALFANFLPEDGDYTRDGNIITSRVGIYPPNVNNLYDMAGNAAEWTSTAYSAAGIENMNNINPQINHDYADSDPYRLKRKVVKGGSWKDPESHIQSSWRTAEYQSQARSYIGFRCVRSIATKPSERVIRIKK